MKATQELLYQVRIKVSEKTSQALRARKHSEVTKSILSISQKFDVSPVCTFDAFCEYCKEAEENGIENYSLYHWTKSIITNLDKRDKHLKSFAFYKGLDQVYKKEIADALYSELKELLEEGLIEELNLIDNNPKNNPQPPTVKMFKK